MKNLTIGLVEDDEVLAAFTSIVLRKEGYIVPEVCRNYEETIRMIEKDKPDVVLLDIHLEGNRDGIDIAAIIKRRYNIPVIFLTADERHTMLEKAKALKPSAYLLKPYTKVDLVNAIEIAMNNKTDQKSHREKLDKKSLERYVFFKDDEIFRKVLLRDIAFIEKKRNQSVIHTMTDKFVLNSPSENVLNMLNNAYFNKCHKDYVVNIFHLETMSYDHLLVNHLKVPLDSKYKNNILSMFNVVR